MADERQAKTTDHDLLIRIDERVLKLDTCMSNHLKHHWAVTIAALGAGFSGIVAAILALLR